MAQQNLEMVDQNLIDLLHRVRDGEPIVLAQGGSPRAALISLNDLKLLDRYMEELEDRTDVEETARIRGELVEKGTYDWEHVKQEGRSEPV